MNIFAVRQQAPKTDEDRIDTLVSSACRLAERSDDVRAIFVIANERPSFHALMRYRAQARARGLTLTMLGTGGVVVRRQVVDGHQSNRPEARDGGVRRNAE